MKGISEFVIVHMTVEDVLGGDISAVTLEAKEEQTIMSCHFEISKSGDRASLKKCQVCLNDEGKLNDAFNTIPMQLQKSGMTGIDVKKAEEVTPSLEKVLS